MRAVDSSASVHAPSFASRRYDCPNCGAPVPFQWSVSLFAVCGHCRSMVVRRDMNLESYGQMAELPPDLSPLQIGTRGYFEGKSFVLIGRLRLHWGDGSWTEWCADFGQSVIGWIAEFMGTFVVSFQHTAPGLDRLAFELKAGERLRAAGGAWMVSDVKEATCMAAEGELPHIAPPGWKRTSVDLTGSDGEFATIEITDEGRTFFSGHYATFEELNLSQLRKVPGWDHDAEIIRRQSEAMNCPKCGAPVNLRAEGLTMTAVCGSCGSMLDASTPQLRKIDQVSKDTLQLKPLLPIGTRGVLKNETWEIIGFMRRKDKWCTWDEYLLFNPWQGFRFLIWFRGHWTLVRSLHGHHTENSLDGEKYALFSVEEATTTAVLGEFYWRVRNGEKAMLSDYISPPRILSKEHYPALNEITWSAGEYIESAEVSAAFLPAGRKLLPPSGAYLIQPNPHIKKWSAVRANFFFLLIAYVILQFLFLGQGNLRPVFETTMAYQATAAGAALVSDKFTVEGASAPLHIRAQGGLETDTYLGLKGNLVNASSQQTYPVSLPLTNYSTAPVGTLRQMILPAIPAGQYYLRLDPDASASLQKVPISLSVERGGLFWSNFWIGFAFICLYPLWVRTRSSSFEKSRWMESDFSPS